MTARRLIRAAVVGAGLMGRWHADAISRAGGTIAWVVDPNAVSAHALAARHPGASVRAELGEILLQDPLDVVHLCTPLDTHAPLVRQALSAGLHVLAEKPLAETAAVTSELLSMAKEHGRLLCPTHQFLFQPGVRRGLAALTNVGPILHVDLLACSAGAVGAFAIAPDGLIGEIVPHPLALLARMFPGALPDVDWQIQHPREGELRATACLGSASVALLVSASAAQFFARARHVRPRRRRSHGRGPPRVGDGRARWVPARGRWSVCAPRMISVPQQNPDPGLIPLHCPRCSSPLTARLHDEAYSCPTCHQEYPVVLGIPDLRVFPDPYIDYADDRAKGRRVLDGMDHASFAAVVRRYWELTPDVPRNLVDGYVSHVLAATHRARSILGETRRAGHRLNARAPFGNGAILEIGCGTGGLLIAAAREYQHVVGVDIAFRWLAIATRRVDEDVASGELTPQQAARIQLVCACAENLPLPPSSFDLVVGASVIEHTAEQADVLRQARRALRPGGLVFLTTVNRLSLAPEPHVHVWGVGLLPRRWMDSYVRRVRGIRYRYIRLLSASGLVELLRRSGFVRWEIEPPPLADADVRRYAGGVQMGARVYNRLRQLAGVRHPLRLFGPLLQVAAVSGDIT